MRIVLFIAGIVGIALAVMYFMIPAASLPLPDALGHQAGSQAIHIKHGVAAALAGIVCLVLARRR